MHTYKPTYVCMHVRKYGCIYVCIYVYVYVHIPFNLCREDIHTLGYVYACVYLRLLLCLAAQFASSVHHCYRYVQVMHHVESRHQPYCTGIS